MKISGQWVGWGLGDIDEKVRQIRNLMRRKFSYAKDLADSTLFDEALVTAVTEMQRRYNADGKLATGKYTPGIVNAETQYVMGLIPRPPGPDTRPLLLTVCGTGVPWWVGPDADVARAVEDKYRWQPVGYPAAPVPMGPSIDTGRAEALFQCERMEPNFENRRRIEQHGLALMGYSQGAIVTSELWEYDIKPGNGRLHWAKDHVRKAITFGNPMREKGMAWPDGGGPRVNMESYGIADKLMEGTPAFWRNYAHEGDLYTDVEGESGENKTAIYQIIRGQRVFSGPNSILRQVLELVGGDAGTIAELTGIFMAIWDAGLFFGRGTGPHVNYGIREAIEYLRS